MLRKLIGLLGLATIAFVIANVHFGIVAENVVEGAGSSRLDVLRLADPGCTIPEMEKEIQETGTAFCLSEKGTWGTADILLLFWGILISMFTAVYVTRTIFYTITKKSIKNISI